VRKSKKIAARLKRRQDSWEALPGSLSRPGTKRIEAMDYHRPGSQNLRKC
jgi:hypothetical protein